MTSELVKMLSRGVSKQARLHDIKTAQKELAKLDRFYKQIGNVQELGME